MAWYFYILIPLGVTIVIYLLLTVLTVVKEDREV